MKDRIETIIRDWLNREFKNPNAIPGPMLKGLAEEIDKHRFEIYESIRDEYDLEDINKVAFFNGIELSKDEIRYALNKYQKAQEYNTSIYALEDIISEIKADRREKK